MEKVFNSIKKLKLYDNFVFYLAIFLLPFENFFFAPSSGWATLTPIVFIIYLLLNIEFLYKSIFKYRRLVMIAILGMLFSLINYFIVGFSLSNVINALISLGFGFVCLLSFTIYYLKTKNVAKLANIMLISYSISLLFGLIQWLTIKFNIDFLYQFFSFISKRNYMNHNRVQFLFTEPSFIGMHLFGVLLPIYYLIKNKKIMFLVIVYSIASLFFSSGVRIILDCIVVFGIILLVYLLKNKKFIYLILLIFFACGSLFFAYKTNYRVKIIFERGIYADGSLASRYFRINASIKGYKNSVPNTLFGYGLGNSLIPLRSGHEEAALEYKNPYLKEVKELADPNFNDDSVSYCLYIRFISEFGIIILIMFSVYVAKLFKNSVFKYKWEILLIILYLYVQFESYAFYSLWLLIVILKFTPKIKNDNVNNKSLPLLKQSKLKKYDEKIKYTFIIPAYNSSKTIKSCLDSICDDIKNSNMDLNVEIIVVENGSSDNTEDVVNEYINNCNFNIKLVKSKKGVSRARNLGLKEAQGDLIIFIDSDDLWISGSLKKINTNDELNNSDLYVYGFVRGTINEEISSCYKVIHEFNSEDLNDVEKIKAWMLSKATLRMQAWAKVYRKDIIKNNDICFLENLRYSEDSEFVIKYLKYCKNIKICKETIYKYTISVGSVMRTLDDTRINGYIESMNASNEVLSGESEIIKKAFRKYVLSHLNIIFVHDVFEIKKKPFKNHTFKSDYKKMKELLKVDVFKDSLNNISIFECFSIMYLPELFLKLHLGIFTAMLCYIKSYLNSIKEKK